MLIRRSCTLASALDTLAQVHFQISDFLYSQLHTTVPYFCDYNRVRILTVEPVQAAPTNVLTEASSPQCRRQTRSHVGAEGWAPPGLAETNHPDDEQA
jgi:hypothetical protein